VANKPRAILSAAKDLASEWAAKKIFHRAQDAAAFLQNQRTL
jgi:hypothetical protein